MATLGQNLGQMPKFKVYILEHGQSPLSDVTGYMKKKMYLQDGVQAVLRDHFPSSIGREYEVLYFDKDGHEWLVVDNDTDSGDLTGVPSFKARFKSPKKVFSASAFLGDERFKKFQKTELPFEKLHVPQEQALLEIRKVLGSARGGARFMCILPTGVGKTVVMALAPFMLESTKVLYIMPDTTLTAQALGSISECFSDRHPLGRTGEVRAEKHLFVASGSADFSADYIVTNIQALVKGGKKKEAEQPDEAPDAVSSSATDVTAAAKIMLARHKPDLVVIDEGHHFPASSWDLFSAAALQSNQECKFLLLTATPQRGDGMSYGLQGPTFFYRFSRKDAIADKYIKNINSIPVEVSFQKPTCRERYVEREYVKSVITPAVQKLKDLRNSCNGVKLRMLVNARTNEHATKTAKLINEFSDEHKWGLFAKAVTGAQKDDNQSTLAGFKCLEATPGIVLVDIVVQVKMLGEGYDNSLIAVTAAVAPAKTVGTLSQFHGRAVRMPRADLGLQGCPLSKESYMFYPNEKEPRTGQFAVKAVVEEYANGADESVDNL